MPIPRLRRPSGPKLPKAIPAEGLFVLISPPDLALEDADPLADLVDGPLDPTAVLEEEGDLVFLTEGFPYRMRVVREEGGVLWLATGAEEGEGPLEVPYRVHPVTA